MEKSQSIVNLAKALLTFHVKVGKIKKDANNPFFKSKYASLSNILEEIETPLQESGLVISQLPTGDASLTTILIHSESGEYLQSECSMHPVKNDPQSAGSAISYFRRYALASILELNVDDDDANTATHGYATPQQAAAQAGKFVNQNGDKPVDLDPNGKPKAWLNKGTKQWDSLVKKLQEGNTSLATAKLYFLMKKEVREELQAFEKKA